jgi:hypothetical protein
MTEKFLVVFEIETEDLAETLTQIKDIFQAGVPNIEGKGWFARDVSLEDVKDFLEEQGKIL